MRFLLSINISSLGPLFGTEYVILLSLDLQNWQSLIVVNINNSDFQYNYDPFRRTGVRLYIGATKGTYTALDCQKTLKTHEHIAQV